LDTLLDVLWTHSDLFSIPVAQVYDTATGCWVETVAMLSKRCRLGVATLNGKIYACGGYDGSSFLRSVECFDPVTNKWVHLPV
jgi:kelch-like protein 18